MTRLRVGILGASGLVSQRMQQRLSNHPWFELAAVAGQSSGTKLSEVQWHLDEQRPLSLSQSDIQILDINKNDLSSEFLKRGVEIVFSALPSQPALNIERRLVDEGIHVFSNASAYRMDPNVALVVADVNPEALHPPQPGRALHACATNCTLIPVLHPLSILVQHHDVVKVVVRSEQALSGAGWKLLHDAELRKEYVGQEIEGEAEKIVEEAEKILSLSGVEWDVQCKRIDEKDGHVVDLEVHLSNRPSFDEILSVLKSGSESPHVSLPSQPLQSMEIVDTEPTRNRFLWNGKTSNTAEPSMDLKSGMTTTVQLLDVKGGVVNIRALSHNTVRGAAGGVVLLAELAHHNDYLASVNINASSYSSDA